ncbi:hypothetical protein JWS04_35355 [Bradyrhizobium vignae]|uniref:Uncharacterized protein n=1 Tax=Bradyrhizobium vignae TaxID=1549949 RepID=A0ABS4A760_9BRAD|nr:hypothetical protein [Bradyrhizobium vignae]
MATAALVAGEWLQREEHVFGAFEIAHYRPKERPNGVKIVHAKNGEEAWWPLFDETGEPLSPELMAELDEVKRTMVSGRFSGEIAHRRASTPLPWITERKDLRYLRSVVKDIIVEAGIRIELSFTSFRHGGFTDVLRARRGRDIRFGCLGKCGRSRHGQGEHESARDGPHLNLHYCSRTCVCAVCS